MSKKSDAITFFKENPGAHRLQELTSSGIYPEAVYRLKDEGVLTCVSRGVYRMSGAEPDRHGILAELSLRIPQGVFCLISALDFHGIGTQLPYDHWVALPRGVFPAKIDEYSVHYCHYGERAYSTGLEIHMIEGTHVRIYSPAKTVVDCFKYRNKLGLEVALEALRDVLQSKKVTIPELLKHAEVCRMKNVMMPYLEGIV